MSATPAPLRIGIDVRYLSHGLVGGVHTYVGRLVPELIEASPADRFVLYADARAPLEIVPPDGVETRILPWRHAASSVLNDARLRRRMAADRIDVAFFPANYGFGPARAATVVTVHDAINLLPLSETLRGHGHVRTWRTAAMTTYLHMATSRAVRQATRIVTMSAYSRDAIVAASGRRREDVDVVPHGAPPAAPVSQHEIEAVLRRYELSPPYVLADGLKNPVVLLEAWQQTDPELRRAVQLVFFSRHPRVLPGLQDAVAAGTARLLVRPSQEELAALYAGAAAFVFPSWIEGFGIPLLEAMSHGTPIVASDRGSIPEVVGDAALLVDAEDARRLALALARVLSDREQANQLRARGAARVARFTWRRSAALTLAALRAAHAQACLLPAGATT